MDFVLRKALEELINQAEFFGESMRPTWSETRFKFVVFCLQEQAVSEEELAGMVRTRLLKWGRTNYEWLFKKGGSTKWPDHAPCSSALAFAIREGELTKREVARIKFDHGDTLDTFIESFAKDLVSIAVRQLCRLDKSNLSIAS